MLDAKTIVDHLRDQQMRYAERDQRWDNVKSVRMGDLNRIAPDEVVDAWPKPIIANFVDTVARDMAELIAPLPAFQCSSATMQSDTARKFADRRTKIVQNYIAQSRLDRQMLEGADHFNTYGICVLYLEPDFEDKLPRICIEDPMGGYADFDRFGRLRSYVKRFYQDAKSLANLFPEFATQIADCADEMSLPGASNMCEVIRYCDPKQIALILLSKEPVTLVSSTNPLGETPIVLARRPWLHKEISKGQFDDSVWIQVARDCLAKLNLQAVQKSVEAPLAVPPDLQEFAIGPDAIIRTQSPEKVRRVGLELPQGAFAESGVLMEELRTGTRYPAARTGGVDASIITGKGVQALLGGFDSQVKAAQLAFRDAFEEVARLAFKMDETYWPSVERNIRGQANGTPYEFTYRSNRDVKGDHSCDVQYGFASGMDPNRAVVMLLQLRAEKAFSRDFFTRQLPFAINVTEEQSKVDVEESREALKQGIYGYVQSIPALAQQGMMDPAEPMMKVAAIIKGLQKGDAIEDVVVKVFAPPPSPEAPPSGGPADMAGAVGPGGPGPGGGGPGGPGGGLTPSGLMEGVPAGQAGQPPGGRPDLSVMLNQLTGQGGAQMSSMTMKRRRI